MSDANEYKEMLKQLKSGQITPRTVVGAGYKNGRAVAHEWLTVQILNAQLPRNEQLSDVFGSASGTAFTSIGSATRSKVYQALQSGTFTTISGLPVVDFGIRPGLENIGFLVWIKVGSRRSLSKVA